MLSAKYKLHRIEALMGQLLAIDDWVKRLAAIPQQEFTIPRIENYLREIWIRPETLQQYPYYARSH